MEKILMPVRFRLVPFTLLLLVLLGALPSYALTPPAFLISDTAGNTATIDMTGTVTFGGSCTSATCFTSQLAFPIPGQITWGGTIGAFTVAATVGTTKPATDPAVPELDISLQRLTVNS